VAEVTVSTGVKPKKTTIERKKANCYFDIAAYVSKVKKTNHKLAQY